MTVRNEGEFMMVYPVFFLLEPGSSSQVMLLQGESDRYIPLFTEEGTARSFMTRKGIEKYNLAKLVDRERLIDFLLGFPDKAMKVAIDPVATDVKTSPALVVLADLLTQLARNAANE